jgi:hypothetical protein
MPKSNDRSEAARKAWETIRRRGKDEPIDTSTPDGCILKKAREAASAAVGRARKSNLPVDEDWMMDAPQRIIDQKFRCAVTGMEFDVEYKTPGAGGKHYAPSPRVPTASGTGV